MIPLYTKTEFNNALGIELLPLLCKQCRKTFYYSKTRILAVQNDPLATLDFCSLICVGLYKTQQSEIILTCTYCNKTFPRLPSQIKKNSRNNKSNNVFCSQSCAAKYNNRHKTHGTRRSKLEVYIESILQTKYPNLDITYNNQTIIDTELDIYIPSLKLAFEMNGIFHYEAIFGDKKLSTIQNNDRKKYQQCFQKNIDLCIIDTLSQKRFTEKSSQKFLNIITTIINEKLDN